MTRLRRKTYISRHAEQRRRERRVTRQEVQDTLDQGQRRWDNLHHNWQYNLVVNPRETIRVAVTPWEDGRQGQERVITTVIVVRH